MKKIKKMKKNFFVICLILAFGLLPGLVWADETAAPEPAADEATQQEQPAAGPEENPAENAENAASENPAEKTDEENPEENPATEQNEQTEPTDSETPETNPEEKPISNLSDPALNQVKLTLDSKWALVRGQSQQIDAAPITINDTTMLPLRFIAQDILEAQVDWNAETKQVAVLRNQLSLLVDLEGGRVLVGPAARVAV